MKTKILSVIIGSVLCLIVPALRASDDLYLMYEEGKALFNAGQFAEAREKLAVVASKNPSHVPTRAMLSQIEQKLGVDNTMLRRSYQAVIIEKIEFADAQLEEAIQAVRILSKKATNEKIIPNIIIKDPALNSKIVSLSLNNVPLTEVLNYLAKLTGARLSYEKNAVMFSNPAG